MQIVWDLEAKLRPGDFAARIDEKEHLVLPKKLFDILAESNVTTAEDFVSLMQAFANSLASKMGWSRAQIDQGLRGLIEGLEGYVHEDILHPQTPRPRPYGVKPARRLF